jgi:hypothetical protein
MNSNISDIDQFIRIPPSENPTIRIPPLIDNYSPYGDRMGIYVIMGMVNS